MTTYYMTAQRASEIGTWEQCTARTLAGAKREAAARYAGYWADSVLCIAVGDNRETQRQILASRAITPARWRRAVAAGATG